MTLRDLLRADLAPERPMDGRSVRHHGRPKRKPLLQSHLTLRAVRDGKGTVYASAEIAAERLGVTASNIRARCRKGTHGWSYL